LKRRIDTKAEEIEEAHGRILTVRQKTFARNYVDGTHSNAECARAAGYSDKNGAARFQAAKLLSKDRFPHVSEYISELREERERKFGVTLMGQLKRLRELSEGAEDNNQFSAAINAEVKRSALGGLTTDRRETSHFHAIENMSRDEVENRLLELRKSHPTVFEADFRVIDDAETGSPVLAKPSQGDAAELEHNTD
jgi:phage terminase small subunit